ncbi:MAG: hypothetical protein KBD39_10335 [Sterolibacterium sp.]|nr:hypothetical protein [Sterolibacterium sp.]
MRLPCPIPLFPLHERYVELLCGAAALYFLRQVSAPVEVLNDIQRAARSFCLQHHVFGRMF